MTEIKALSAAQLAEATDIAYASMGKLACSMKDMAFLSGAMTVVDMVTAIEEAARHDQFEAAALAQPPQRLDMHTLAYVKEVMIDRAMRCAKGLVVLHMTETPQGPEETVPFGVKPN